MVRIINVMKLCITADVHVGVPGRLDDIMWSLRKIRQYNHDHGIKDWLVLGDLLHNRESLNIKDLQELVAFLQETDEMYGQIIHTFPGNHDMYQKNTWDINSLKPLVRYIKYYGDICTIELGGQRFWILPFIHYETDYMKELAKIEQQHEDGDILLTHVGVKSATLNTCFLLKSWSVVDFTNSKFDIVYTGHFHAHQKVGDNVWYPGSPIPFKFDEGDIDHGFFVFDTETRTHEFISIWHGGKEEDAPPQFMTLSDNDIDDIPEDDIRGNIIRISLSKEYTHNQKLQIREKLQELGAKDVRWMNTADKESVENIEKAQNTVASASELFDKYIEADKDGIKGLNKALLTRLNNEIVADGDRQYTADYDFGD